MAKDTRTRMLEATSRLLLHRGYHGVSLREVLEESRAPRGSLYHHFPGGKDQLVFEATKCAVEETTAALAETMAAARSPGRGVQRFFEEAARLMEKMDYAFGCPVAPVVLDGSGGMELARLCREAFEEWLALLHGAFVGAGIPDRRAEALALLVESALEGLLVISRAQRDVRAFGTVAAELSTVVDAAIAAA